MMIYKVSFQSTLDSAGEPKHLCMVVCDGEKHVFGHNLKHMVARMAFAFIMKRERQIALDKVGAYLQRRREHGTGEVTA